MRTFAWTVLGFVAGVAAAVAAFALYASSHLPGPIDEKQTVARQTTPDVPSDSSGEAETISNDPLGDLDVTARMAMMRWMVANPRYEFITRDYCGCHDIPMTDCPPYDEASAHRLADYPYADALDYNGDGQTDFAVMLGLKGKKGPQVLLVFNGPFGDDIPTPAFVREGWEQRDQLSGGYVGHAESDNGFQIKAKGATYELVYTGDPD